MGRPFVDEIVRCDADLFQIRHGVQHAAGRPSCASGGSNIGPSPTKPRLVLLRCPASADDSILLSPGLSVGILLGGLVIVSAWVLSMIYVLWANKRYDRIGSRVERCRGVRGSGGSEGLRNGDRCTKMAEGNCP
jgi:hypothetical protein